MRMFFLSRFSAHDPTDSFLSLLILSSFIRMLTKPQFHAFLLYALHNFRNGTAGFTGSMIRTGLIS
jgi:hypothetical protein